MFYKVIRDDMVIIFFFFQAEDGIRDIGVTGVQTCALPIYTAWQEQVRANGGLIIAIDGIQPDKGNETVYLVRDVLTGRLLAAENVRVSSSEVIQALLAPVVALHLPVLGAISDAQESLCQAIAALWPDIPHQLCQFHYLREAGDRKSTRLNSSHANISYAV